jgi:hypothetical protein
MANMAMRMVVMAWPLESFCAKPKSGTGGHDQDDAVEDQVVEGEDALEFGNGCGSCRKRFAIRGAIRCEWRACEQQLGLRFFVTQTARSSERQTLQNAEKVEKQLLGG